MTTAGGLASIPSSAHSQCFLCNPLRAAALCSCFMSFPSAAICPILLALSVATCGERATTQSDLASPSQLQTIGSWSDEFDGPAGAFPDPSRWTYDLGNNGGWGNGELQEYTASRNNVHLDGEGHLVIRVEATAGGYTSARLKTQGLRVAQFGRVEARIKLPVGQGIWPAFWMLGSSFNGSNWPQCGEIDVMEYKGSQQSVVHGTVHGPKYSGAGGITAAYALPRGDSFAEDFHTFALQWEPGSIRLLVDGTAFHTITPQQIPPGAPWVFDQRFFVVLNVAVGGSFVGSPDRSTAFPQEMSVDYVRYSP
jgi:beta-glucanase (GH16 family)